MKKLMDHEIGQRILDAYHNYDGGTVASLEAMVRVARELLADPGLAEVCADITRTALVVQALKASASWTDPAGPLCDEIGHEAVKQDDVLLSLLARERELMSATVAPPAQTTVADVIAFLRYPRVRNEADLEVDTRKRCADLIEAGKARGAANGGG